MAARERPSLTREQAEAIKVQAASVFTPRGPVTTRELFSGRWDQINTLMETVAQSGLHAVIYGERGVGKTSLANIIGPIVEVSEGASPNPQERVVVRVNANASDTFSTIWTKALDEIVWTENRPRVGFDPGSDSQRVTLRQALQLGSELAIDDVRRTLAVLKRSVFVIDEFDRLPKRAATQFTDLVKALSDSNVAATIVVVGIADTVDGLVKEHASINRALIQVLMPRMSLAELKEILSKGEEKLGMKFSTEAAERIVRLSQGLPHFTHLAGLHSVRVACDLLSPDITASHVTEAFERIVKNVDQTVSSQWDGATRSAQSEALYKQVLLACAIAAAASGDAKGYFQPASVADPLSLILKRAVEIATFNRHLAEFCEEHRHRVLERTGRPRSYRYRFRDPLMPPYIMMRGVAQHLVNAGDIEGIIAGI